MVLNVKFKKLVGVLMDPAGYEGVHAKVVEDPIMHEVAHPILRQVMQGVNGS